MSEKFNLCLDCPIDHDKCSIYDSCFASKTGDCICLTCSLENPKCKSGRKLKPDYQGFVEHVEAWDKRGIPWGISDLIRLAERYGTPIPKNILKNRPIILRFEKQKEIEH